MKVLFMPDSMITLLWRIASGLSGRSLYEKISPIAGKLEQKIFSPKLSIFDDPLNDAYPGARSWDDEGVPCKKLSLIEQGVLKDFFYDLKYAEKTGATPTVTFIPWAGMVGMQPGTYQSVDGAGPVIKTVVLNDQGTTEPADDQITVTWSEPLGGWNSTALSANQVLTVWKPITDSLPGLLTGCPIYPPYGIRAIVDVLNGAMLETNHWFSIDSIQGGVKDIYNNYSLKTNRKVQLQIVGPAKPRIIIYPNPINYERLKNPGSGYQPHISLLIYDTSEVSIMIYDLAGNLVRKFGPMTLANNIGVTGTRARTHVLDFWDGTNGRGRIVNRGGYIAKALVRPLGGKAQPLFFKLAVQ